MQNKKVVAWVLLFILASIWGSSFILIKKGLLSLAPEELGSLRIVTASACLLPFALQRISNVEKRKIKALTASGFLGSLIPSFLFAIAQTRLESSITGVLNALVPIFTILIALAFLGQKQSRKVWLGVVLGFIGTSILVTAGNGNLGGINSYALLVVLATICYASNLNLISVHLSSLPALTITSISLMMVGPLAAIHLFFFTGFLEKFGYVDGMVLATIYISLLGVLGTSVALVIFNHILQLTSPLFVSSVTYIIPVIAVIWGVVDGETLSPYHFLGMAGVGIGVYVANSNRAAFKKKKV